MSNPFKNNEKSIINSPQALIKLATSNVPLEDRYPESDRALYALVHEWMMFFGCPKVSDDFSVSFEYPKQTDDFFSKFPLDRWHLRLENFFLESSVLKNAEYLKEDHVRIILFLTSLFFTPHTPAIQEKKCFRTFCDNNDTDTKEGDGRIDLLLHCGSKVQTAVELKLLTKFDVDEDGKIKDQTKRGKELKGKGINSTKELEQFAKEQIKSYYGFTDLSREDEMKIGRVTILVTPYGVSMKEYSRGYYPFTIGSANGKELSSKAYHYLNDWLKSFQEIKSKYFLVRIPKSLDQDAKVQLQKRLTVRGGAITEIKGPCNEDYYYVSMGEEIPVSEFRSLLQTEDLKVRFFADLKTFNEDKEVYKSL